MIEMTTQRQFQKLDHDFNQLFSMPLRQHTLLCEKTLRILPKKRIVVLGAWKDKKIVAKIFFSRRAEQHMRDEIKGARMLTLAKIHTPNIIFYGQSIISGVYFVIYKYIEHAVDIQDIWINKQEPNQLKVVLFSMQDILIKQHQNGLYYTDLHPHNFILGSDHTYLIDPAEVKCVNFKLALSVDKSLENLVVLYSQLAPKFQTIVIEAFHQYSLARGWKITHELEKHMLTILYKERCLRLGNYLKKTNSTCRTFVAKSTLSFRFACMRNELTDEMRRFFQSPGSMIQGEDILKNGNTCTTFRTKLNDKTVVVKRYNVKNFWHFLKLSCQEKSRALRSWENANALELLCVPSPKPIAFLENRFLGIFRKESYYIFEYVEGEILEDYFPKITDQDEMVKVAKQMMGLLQIFSCMRIAHGDMKATNFVYHFGKIYVLDLDAMKFCLPARQFAKCHKKDVARMLKNWENHPNIARCFEAILKE